MKENYLPQHTAQAVKEEKCFWKMLERMENQFVQGNFDEVTRSAMDALSSMKQLEFMRHQKQHQELASHLQRQGELNKVIIDLQKKGILKAQVRWPNEKGG
ncbi:hypothetical protein MUN89_15855 [Halobacillus salinarum]|uniref:Uncharacterized protein n=1 Tax=Halobacillus salinarum TaxID=2932257 RepID=A0ABY4EHL9_9BACI|nr:hypothetical protein [Halobacillus salinarum]UOQ43383.1 hypothetical protein MUN89_15855 [Halobacillus salinarum]